MSRFFRHSGSSTGRSAGIDRTFLTLIIVEVVFGFIMLASASAPIAWNSFHSTWHFALHQLYAGIVPGLIIMYVLSRIDYHFWGKWALWVFVATLIGMVLVFVPGLAAEFGTARSWIFIGGISIQPTEVLKLTFILYVAALFSTRDVGKAKESLLPAVIAFAVSGVLLMLQPDLGSLMLFATVFVLLIIAAGIPMIYVFGAASAGVALLIIFAKSAPYRAARLNVFLHPELDPQGIGYQINQALLAIGSGGLGGLGLGHSRQKYQYLPQVMNDSIFPIIAEELGFFFTIGLLVLIVAIFFRGLRIARGARDQFGRLVAIGVVGWLTIQAFLNIGAMLGLLPLTGLTLPFVSYGSSSMIAALAAVGIVMNISRGTNKG